MPPRKRRAAEPGPPPGGPPGPGEAAGAADGASAADPDHGRGGLASGPPPAPKRRKGAEAPAAEAEAGAEGAADGEADASGDRRAGLAAWERRLWGEGYEIVAGTDEAGRGPLAGPVVSGAFAVLPAGREDAEVLRLLEEVADSKELAESAREGLFARLTDPGLRGKVAWAVVEVSSSEIDESNILKASLASMSRAVCALDPRPDCVLVDGCNRPPELLRKGEQWTRGTKASEMAKADAKQQRLGSFFKAAPRPAGSPAAGAEAPWRPRLVENVIEGDGRVPCISAASVLAKVQRDRVMKKLHEEYPQYGFAEHKGYGTKSHLEAIEAHGPCPVHRRSFGPLKEALAGASGELKESGQRLLQSLGLVAPAADQRLPLPAKEAGTLETPERRGRLPEGVSASKGALERPAGHSAGAAKEAGA